MKNIFGYMYHGIWIFITSLLLLLIVGCCDTVPEGDKSHSARTLYSGRWGRWCVQDIECGYGFCQNYICRCYPGYITWRIMNVCNYEQRTKRTAFLVSFFVGIFGVDWFVLSRGQPGYIIAGFIKLFISCGCIIGWPIAIIGMSKKEADLHLLSQIINVILSLTSFIWWLTDWIRILADVFHDGHGAPLQAWGYDYYDRVPYRMYN